MKHKMKLSQNALRKALQNLKIIDGPISPRNSESKYYGRICKYLHVSNVFKNRIKIYSLWKKLNVCVDGQNLIEDAADVVPTEAHRRSPSPDHDSPYLDSQSVMPKEYIDSSLFPLECEEVVANIFEGENVPSTSTSSNADIGFLSSENVKPQTTNKKCVSPDVAHVPKVILNLSSANTSEVLLPIGSQNVSTLEAKTNFPINEGSTIINEPLWNEMFEVVTGKLKKDYYPYILKKVIEKHINNTCQIIFKYVKYLKNKKIMIKALCNHKNCKKFKIYLNKDRNVTVHSEHLNYCHAENITMHVRGLERKIFKNKLLKEKACTFKKETVLNINEKQLSATHDLKKIKSDATLRKIRSEALSINDRDKNDILDLISYQEDHMDFVREISFPLNVKLYSCEQVECLKHEGPTLLYLDATGSIVRDVMPNSKKSNRILLYSGIIQLRSTERLFPVFSMISALHDTNSIFKMLNDFKIFCQNNKCWPAFTGVVTDFSLALINATCTAFNQRTLLDYLNYCYINLTDEKLNRFELTPLYLCVAHLMKCMCMDVDRAAIQKKSEIKEMLAKIYLLTDLNEISMYLKSVFVLLKSQFVDDAVLDARRYITNHGVRDDNDLNKVIFSQTNTSVTGLFSDGDSNYKKNLFYHHFNDISNDVCCETESCGYEINSYYDLDFLDLLLKKYIPYLPMWTNVLKQDRVSNAPVENYFGHLKHNTLNNRKKIKCSQFIRVLRSQALALAKEYCLIKKKTKLCTTKSVNKNSEQEMWNKKKKASFSHFEGRYLQKMRPTVELTNDDVILNCLYCGRSDNTTCLFTKWVQCDACEQWIHQSCAREVDECKSEDFSSNAEFYCNHCNTRVAVESNKNASDGTSCLDSVTPTTDKLQFLENGLVNDTKYYKEIGRGYVVNCMEDIEHTNIKSLLIDDFLSLNKKCFLVDCVVDHLFHIFNKGKFHLVMVEKSYHVFGDDRLNNSFLNSIKIDDEKDTVFPICRHSHYTMVILSKKSQTLEIVDPFGNEDQYKNLYIQKINRLLHLKGDSLMFATYISRKHYIQNDGHNCGPILIDIFRQIVESQPQRKKRNYNKYRNTLKLTLLEHSDNMKQRCLFCCRKVKPKESIQCGRCLRKIHRDCYTSKDEKLKAISPEGKQRTNKTLCDLCI